MRKGFRRISIMLLALVMVVSMSAVSLAAGKISEKTAINKALKNAKLTKSKVTALYAEYDEGKYEVEFIKKSNNAEYSYEYSKKGKLLEKSIDYRYKHNYSGKKVSKTKALKKAASYTGIKYKTVKKGYCNLEKDDGEWKYEIKFHKGSYEYEVDILAPTGKVIDYSKEYIG